MSWGEAVRAAATLVDDPTSHAHAAVTGDKRPWSREWEILADLYDAFRDANFVKPKPYPRPWRVEPVGKRHGRTDKSRAEVVSILNAHGHKIAG